MPRRSAQNFKDDTEDPIYEVCPTDNVYSYFMFITPTEEKKEHSSYTWDILMAYLLVAINFFMQGILLYTIFYEVVIENNEWQNEIGHGLGDQANLNLFEPASHGCNEGGSLCFIENGNFTCAPPSIQLSGRWEELDTNGDGIWTREEVVKARDELKCKYAVDPVEVFDVFLQLVLQRKKVLWLHPDLVSGKAIHKPYFTFAMGDVVMCGYRNQDMCSNLLKRGFFDAPLKYGTSPRVGKDINSALDYCYELLAPGGICERTLPSTYAVWKIESVQQCGGERYQKFTYKHPGTGNIKSLLEVDYKSRRDYEVSKTLIFKTYKGIILSLWLLAMLVQFKEIIIILTWVCRFPSAAQFGEEFRIGPSSNAVEERPDPTDPGDVKYIIKGISRQHRVFVGILILARLAMTSLLAWVGACFLMRSTDYIDLLLDGVALLFIVEIANVLYAQVLRPDIKDQTEDLEPMKVPMFGIDWLNRRPAVVDMISLAVLLCVVLVGIHMHYAKVVDPVYNALECTCNQQGEKCLEAQKFNREFWHDYWKVEMPGVFKDVSQLKHTLEYGSLDGAEGASSPSPAPSPAVSPAEVTEKVNLHRHLHHRHRFHHVETLSGKVSTMSLTHRQSSTHKHHSHHKKHHSRMLNNVG